MTDNKDNIIKDLNAKLTEKDKEINDLKNKNTTKDNEIKNLKTQIDTKEKEKKDLSNKVTSKENEIKDLKTKLTAKENEENEAKKQLNQINTQINEKDKIINQNKSVIAENEKNINNFKSQISAKEEEIKGLKSKLTEKEKEVNALKPQITEKDNKIKQNQTAIEEKDKQISNLKTEITKKDNQIIELNNQIKEKVNVENNKKNEIINLNNNIKQKDEEIKTLKEEINKIKNENENKIKELSTKDTLINELETKIKNNVELQKVIEEKKAIILELERIKKMVIPDLNGKRLYDISLNFNSIKSIKEGWNLKLSELGLNYFNSTIKCRKIGVIGNKRVGKSFILSCLFGLPYSLTPFHTNEKIGIKFKLKKSKKKDKKENKNIEFIVFDTDGFNLPILEERNEREELETSKDDSNINNKEEKKEENDNENNNNNKNNIIKGQKNNDTPLGDSEEISENLSKSCFDLNDEYNTLIKNTNNIEELKINKILTEDFIIRFMIDCSDILIMVVGLLKYSEQKLLNKVMEQCVKQKKDNLYVIHNLKSLTKKEQVDDYIKEVLMNSGLAYELEEIKEIRGESDFEEEEEENQENSEEKDENRFYFTCKYKSLTINHFIFINCNCEDEEKYLFNEFTKKNMISILNNSKSREFNISKSFKEKIFELLKDYSKNKIKEENIQIIENNQENNSRKIIYKGEEDLKLIKYIKNDVNNTRSELMPKYSYHKSNKEGKEKLCILVETPGEITDESIKPRIDNMKYYIQYKGKKSLSEEERKVNDNINIIGREFGEFTLEIPISMKDYIISNLKEPKCYNDKGIKYIEYELDNISNINIELKNGTYSKTEKDNKQNKFN